MRARERVLAIVLGIILGIAILIAFLFLGSRGTIDDPSISGGGDEPAQTQEEPAPTQPAPGEPNPAP
jgi:hypothetical protein